MTDIENVRKASNGRALFVWGAVLLLLGIAGIVRYVIGASHPGEGTDATSDGVWQSLTIIAAALATGAGLVMLVLGYIKRARRDTGADERKRDSA
jgi:hypothetical protein